MSEAVGNCYSSCFLAPARNPRRCHHVTVSSSMVKVTNHRRVHTVRVRAGRERVRRRRCRQRVCLEANASTPALSFFCYSSCVLHCSCCMLHLLLWLGSGRHCCRSEEAHGRVMLLLLRLRARG